MLVELDISNSHVLITLDQNGVVAMYNHTRLPVDLWLGRGRPLNPYLIGYIVNYLREKMRPKELKLMPDELFGHPAEKDFIEWSTLRSWVRQWLKYTKWYLLEPYPRTPPLVLSLMLQSLIMNGVGLCPTLRDLGLDLYGVFMI